MAVVYLHKRCDTKEVFYVGIGKNKSRAYVKSNRSKFWLSYTNAHEYFVEVLTENVDWEEACKIERELISFYGRRDLGFGELLNHTDGGEGVFNPSIEVRNKISETSKGNKNFLGKRHLPETKEKISNSRSVSVSQFSRSGVFIRDFSSIDEAAAFTGADKTTIGRACKGRRGIKYAKGFIWKYKLA